MSGSENHHPWGNHHHGGPPGPHHHPSSVPSHMMNFDPRYHPPHPHHHHPGGYDQHPSPYWYPPSEGRRRDSVPYGSQPQEMSSTTPLQPPNHYNGPPVSALVPRIPRQNTMYEQGRYNPRQSFGFNSHFLIPTPPETRNELGEQTPSDDSPPPIPPPPQTAQRSDMAEKREETPVVSSPKARTPLANANSLPDSNRINLMDKKFDAPPQPNRANAKEANLLLSLKSESPVPDKNANPKSCFPAKIPKNYPKRLSLPNDHTKLNSLHCFVREELLEIFVVEPSNNKKLKFRHAPSSSVGRVGLRCVHCHAARATNPSREDEAPMAVFYPKSVAEIYRLVTSWQRCHVRKCKSLPPDLRKRWDILRATEKSRGKTAYWVESARQIGLRECPSRAGGVFFHVEDDTPLDEEPEEVVA